MVLNETFFPNSAGTGGYYKDDDGTRHDILWDDVNNTSDFARAAEKKGPAAKFALDHKIDLIFSDRESRAWWLGKEAHYDVDHYFYITNVPIDGLENDRIAFQLRVSNHPTCNKQWETTHSLGGPRCDFCLNLIMNPYNRPVDKYNDAPSEKTSVATINCNLQYHGSNMEKINQIVDAIVSGSQPVLDYYKDVIGIFGGGLRSNVSINVTEAGDGFRELNFKQRPNRVVRRKYYPFHDEEPKEEPKLIPEPKSEPIPVKKKEEMGPIRQVVTMSEIMDLNPSDMDIIELDGRKYQFHYAENGAMYLFPQRAKRHMRGKVKDEDRFYFDDSPEGRIEISTDELGEGLVRLTKGDIFEMVRSCLERILY